MAESSGQDFFDWKINSSFHQRIIGSYLNYKVAIGIYELKSKSIVTELLIRTPTKHPIEIENSKSFTYRKDKSLNGIWLGTIHTAISKPTNQLFDIIIDEVIIE